MNIPYKITKTSYLSQDKAQSYQKTASKYYKQHQKLKKEYEQSNISSNIKSKSTKTKNFREEVMKWFFSLDLMTKLIVSSIENKWITCILHQLYVNQKYEPRLKYRIKEYDFFNFSNQNSANEYIPSVLKVTINENAYNSMNYIPSDYLDYSHYFSKEDGYYNNYVSLSSMNEVEKNFLENIIFYRSEEVLSEIESTSKTSQANIHKYSNYFTLSEKLLQDENLFKIFFNKMSNNLAFGHLIDSSYEQTTKCFNICLPDWVKNREFYSLAEIFTALFEQVISVRYVLFKQNQSEFANQRTHLQFVNDEKDQLMSFMNKNLAMNEVYKAINTDEIVNQLYKDKIIEDFIVNRFHQGDKNGFYVNIHKVHREFLFDKNKIKIEDLKLNVEKFFKSFRNPKDFLNSLTFLPLDKIFSFDDFLFRKFYEALMNLRSQQNAMDLMKELEFEDDYSELKSERKKSESVSMTNGVNGGTCNPLLGGNNAKANKKKKKKKGSNAMQNTNPKLSSVNNNKETKIEITEENNKINQENISKIQSNSSAIVPSIDLEHIILEIRNDHKEGDSNDIEKHLTGTGTEATNSVASCSNEAEYLALNNEKKYAFSFIKRTKSNLQQKRTDDSSSDNLNSHHPDADFEIAKDVFKDKDNKDNKDSNTVKYTSKEFLGSIMLFKQKDDINNENNVMVKEIIDEMIVQILTDKKESIKINSNEFNGLISTTVITKKSLSPCESVKHDQNDVDTAYSSDGNKSESTENRLLNQVNGKINKRKKENKFFLYNIKESNLTGYKEKKESTKNRENNNNSLSKNENRKLSQQTGEMNTQKIMKQIIDQHFEKKNEEEDAEIISTTTINSNNYHVVISSHDAVNGLADCSNPQTDINNNTKINFSTNEENTVSIIDDVKISEIQIEEKTGKNEIIKISDKIINLDNSPLNYKVTSNSPKTMNNFIKSNLNKEFESKYSNHFIENGYSSNYKKNYKNFTNYPAHNMFYPRTNFNMNFQNLYPYMKPIKPMKPYNTFSNFPSKENFMPNSGHIRNHGQIPYDLFHMKLQRDILEFSAGIDYNLKKLKPIKISTISFLENFIRKFFETNFDKYSTEIELYGSYASELGIESSDIDITIKIDHKSVDKEGERDADLQIIEIMSSLVENFKALGVFEVISPIYTATVPVVKLVLDPSYILDQTTKDKLEEFKQSDPYKNYIFNIDDLNKIRIDLTFSEQIVAISNTQNPRGVITQAMNGAKCETMSLNSISPSHSPSKIITQLHLDYIRECLIIYPELKPLTQILKRFLQNNKLHCSFNGGLSSFSLFLILLAYIKLNRLNFSMGIGTNPSNIGKLFKEFLMFYGNLFEFNFTVIDVNMDNPFVLCSQPLDAIPTILDPITYLNAGKSSYRTTDIKHIFSTAFERLNDMKIFFEKNGGVMQENFVNLLLLTEIKGNL